MNHAVVHVIVAHTTDRKVGCSLLKSLLKSVHSEGGESNTVRVNRGRQRGALLSAGFIGER